MMLIIMMLMMMLVMMMLNDDDVDVGVLVDVFLLSSILTARLPHLSLYLPSRHFTVGFEAALRKR